MDKVLLDTNILLDIMLRDRPGADAADQLMHFLEAGKVCAAISAGSLKDMYYISCKYLDEQLVRNWVRFFMSTFEVLSIDKAVCSIAIDSIEPDFEDGIIRAIAENEAVSFILTRDVAAFKNCRVRSLDVQSYIKILSCR